MIAQIFIMILGASAIYLTTLSNAMRKYGYVLGLLSQPFWFYTTYINDQWGVFIMCFVYTFSWFRGVWKSFHIHWFRKYYRKHEDLVFTLRECRCGLKQGLIYRTNKWENFPMYYDNMRKWTKDWFDSSRIVGDPSKPYWNDKIS